MFVYSLHTLAVCRYTSGIPLYTPCISLYTVAYFSYTLYISCISLYALYLYIPVVHLCILLHTKVREDEISELEILLGDGWLPVEGGVENSHGKVNILLQTYISQGTVDSFSLVSDLAYVAQVSFTYTDLSLQLFHLQKTGKALSKKDLKQKLSGSVPCFLKLSFCLYVRPGSESQGGFETVPCLQIS